MTFINYKLKLSILQCLIIKNFINLINLVHISYRKFKNCAWNEYNYRLGMLKLKESSYTLYRLLMSAWLKGRRVFSWMNILTLEVDYSYSLLFLCISCFRPKARYPLNLFVFIVFNIFSIQKQSHQ